MAYLKHSQLIVLGLGMFLVSTLSAHAEQDLSSLSYSEFVEKYKDSDTDELSELSLQIIKEKAELKSGKSKQELEDKAAEYNRLVAKNAVSAYFKADLTRYLGSSDVSDVRRRLGQQIKEELAKQRTAADLPDSEEKALSVIKDLGKESAFSLELKFWKKDGKVVVSSQVLPKAEHFSKDLPLTQIKEIKKHIRSEEILEMAQQYAANILGEVKTEMDPSATDGDRAVSISLGLIQDRLKLEKGEAFKNLAVHDEEKEIEKETAKEEYNELKEKSSIAGAAAKLDNMKQLIAKLKSTKDRSLEACKLVVAALGKGALDKEEYAACFPEEVAAHQERKAAAKMERSHASNEENNSSKEEIEKKPELPQAKVPQMNPQDMQLALQREANVAACLGANQQMMAAAPQMALDAKFNSLLQGFESVVTGSTLLPQVLVSIPEDLTGPGALLQAQNAVEDLTKDWNLRDPEIHDKVKKELRAAEMATSKAAADYEAYRFRLSRIGLLDPMMGLPLDSPEMIKMAKLERNMAAAGALKDSLQKMHGTIREMTNKTLNPLNSSTGRTSRESLVPQVGVPRVAPSR